MNKTTTGHTHSQLLLNRYKQPHGSTNADYTSPEDFIIAHVSSAQHNINVLFDKES